MALVSSLTAIVLAAVFGVAGVAKLRDRSGTARAVRAFGVPALLAPTVAVMLPVAELAVSGALLLPPSRVVAAAVALGLLAVFSAAIGLSLASGRTPSCHCFGHRSAPVSGRTLVRNAVLAAVAVGLLLTSRGRAGETPGEWLAHLAPTELALAGGAILIVGLVARAATSLRGVTADAPHGLAPGTPAPWAPLAPGGAGRPALLVFTSTGCGPCHELLPSVARWQRELGDRLTVAVASSGDPDASGLQEADHGLEPMLLDEDGALSDAFRVAGTPSAVLIAADGTIAASLAAGADAIESLVARAARSAPPGGREPTASVDLELGRALSTAMPRRTALRTLGAALVLAAIPSLRPDHATARVARIQACPGKYRRCFVRIKYGTHEGGCYDPAYEQCCKGPNNDAEHPNQMSWTCSKDVECGSAKGGLCVCRTRCKDGGCCPKSKGRCVAGSCCPAIRTTFAPGTDGKGVACCPPGTVAVPGATGKCCPKGDPTCCDPPPLDGDDELTNLGPKLERGQLCVKGKVAKA